MSLQIDDDCDSVFGCVKGVLITIYCIAVICVVLRVMYRIRFFTKKLFSFEQIPLSTTIIQSILQLVLNIVKMNTKLIIAALYCQTLTFGIISTSCIQLSLRIKYPHKSKTAKRYSLMAYIIIQTASITIFILTLLDIIPLDCNDWFQIAYLFPMIVMCCYTLTSISFGTYLIRVMKKPKTHGYNQIIDNERNEGKISQNQNESKGDNDDLRKNLLSSQKEQQDQSNNSDIPLPALIKEIKSESHNFPGNISKEGAFGAQLKKQLLLIEGLFLFTILLQISMDLIRTYLLEDCISCQGSINEISGEFQANNDEGYLFMIFYQIVQITPCLIAPYIFYYVPFKAKGQGNSILLSERGDSFNLGESALSLDSKSMLPQQLDFCSHVTFSQNGEGKPVKPDLNKVYKNAQKVAKDNPTPDIAAGDKGDKKEETQRIAASFTNSFKNHMNESNASSVDSRIKGSHLHQISHNAEDCLVISPNRNPMEDQLHNQNSPTRRHLFHPVLCEIDEEQRETLERVSGFKGEKEFSQSNRETSKLNQEDEGQVANSGQKDTNGN